MKTYIINLESAQDRKSNIIRLLSNHKCLDYEFIKAYDGRKKARQQLNLDFNINAAEKKIARKITPSEIGCTLSHRKCYQSLLDSTEYACLILEDDIDSIPIETGDLIRKAEHLLNVDKPIVILLSDFYWWSKIKEEFDGYKIVNVFNGYLTHSYLINRSAAQLLLKHQPDYIADDWYRIRKYGITIYAFLPYLIRQRRNGDFKSSICQSTLVIKNKARWYWVQYVSLFKAKLITRILTKIGHYCPFSGNN